MQTVQFKVLNTDTQETNVQMQTENTEAENKAQNTHRNKEKDKCLHRADRSYGCGKCQMGCRFAVKKMCL